MRKDIELREEKDYLAFEDLIRQNGNKTEPHKMPQFSKYDAWTTNGTENIAVVELKTREDYHIIDFDTFLLSLHKVDELKYGRMDRNAQKSILVAFYPLDNKTAIFDLTDLSATDCEIKWVYTWTTHYDQSKGKKWQPYAELSLTEGSHGNYSTKIVGQNLENYV